jgi:hypothetical protein
MKHGRKALPNGCTVHELSPCSSLRTGCSQAFLLALIQGRWYMVVEKINAWEDGCMGYRYSQFLLLSMVLALCVACSHPPQVRATLDDVLADPEAYEDAELIITASIGDVLEQPHLYRERRVEVSGMLAYYGSKSFWTWYLMLADQQYELRCYTKHYRVSVGRDAAVLMPRVRNEGKPLTVNGFVRNGGIDIREILYDGQLVRPSFKPPVMPVAPGRVY